MKRYFFLSIFLLSLLLLGGCAKQPDQSIQSDRKDTERAETRTTEENSQQHETPKQDTQTNNPAQTGDTQQNIPAAENGSAAITSDEAEAKAISHAGFSDDQVTVVKNKLDYEDGKMVYEIEFYAGENQEYDYEIDAKTGEILSFDYDAEHYAPQSGDPVTAKEARKLALAKVSGASDGDIFEFETDQDEDGTKYEGKIIFDGMEYEFEIDAANGSFLSWEVEKIN